jgi:hypothetical protein
VWRCEFHFSTLQKFISARHFFGKLLFKEMPKCRMKIMLSRLPVGGLTPFYGDFGRTSSAPGSNHCLKVTRGGLAGVVIGNGMIY